MERRIRGSGLRYTLPYVARYAGLWMVVTVAAVLVAAVSSYLLFANQFGGETVSGLRTALVVQTVLSIVAVVALGVFTTHRLAGPWIAVRRALDSVRDGNLETPLRLRASDPRIREVEVAFEQMVKSLRERLP